MEKILPVYNIPIKALQYHAYVFSILNDDKNKTNYLVNNYQILTVRNIKFPHLDFLHNELTGNSDIIEKHIISNKVENIIGIIIDAIFNDFYIILNINEYYLHNRKAYQTKYFRHDIMIYGFNNSQCYFYTLGYNQNNKFCEDINSFDEINNGYNSLESDWDFEIILIKPKLVEIKINKAKIYRDLNIECHGLNPFRSFEAFLSDRNKVEVSGRKCYGIKCYDFLDIYLNDSNKKNIDMRSFEILCEHFKITTRTLNLLNVVYDNDLEKKIYKCKILALKYNLTGDLELLDTIKKSLYDIKNSEQDLLKFITNNNR